MLIQHWVEVVIIIAVVVVDAIACCCYCHYFVLKYMNSHIVRHWMVRETENKQETRRHMTVSKFLEDKNGIQRQLLDCRTMNVCVSACYCVCVRIMGK